MLLKSSVQENVSTPQSYTDVIIIVLPAPGRPTVVVDQKVATDTRMETILIATVSKKCFTLVPLTLPPSLLHCVCTREHFDDLNNFHCVLFQNVHIKI